MTKPWPARIAAFLLWALAAVSASFWFTQVSGSARPAPSFPPLETEVAGLQTADLARLFGPPVVEAPAPLPAAVLVSNGGDRLRLLGVVANRAQSGVALISVDGQPPRPYRVGSTLEGGWKLQKVGARSATLTPTSSDGAALTLELPSLSGMQPGADPQVLAPMRSPAAAAAMDARSVSAAPSAPPPAGDDDNAPRN